MKSTSYNIEAGEIEAGEHSNTNLLIYFYFVFVNLNVVSGRIMQTKYHIYIYGMGLAFLPTYVIETFTCLEISGNFSFHIISLLCSLKESLD